MTFESAGATEVSCTARDDGTYEAHCRWGGRFVVAVAASVEEAFFALGRYVSDPDVRTLFDRRETIQLAAVR
ncbi:MAG TPA: hypothetical protein VEA38_15075 [Terriglobales bacterium]|nr:hypothetical protein [Terriglobales bacterium]